MIGLLLLIIFCYHIQSVTAETLMIIRSPVNQSACVGGTVNFTCVVMFTSGTLSAAFWVTDNGNNVAASLPGHTKTDDSNGRSAPANVTTVLTVTNVSISDNGADYICAQGFITISDTAFLFVFGPPGNVTDLNISSITACSIVVQWSRPSSDPVCGTVWYTVTISSEGGVMIITDNTTITSYDVTGLNDNTVYHVSVTASNNAGSSSSVTIVTMTNSNGLPSSPLVTTVTPLSDTSFTINWTPSDPDYNYTVMWTNLNTFAVDNNSVSENSHTVTGLNDTDNYNVSVIAMGECGIMTSDPITVYDSPNEPDFDCCISYIDGNEALQIISHVTVTTPRTSLSLTFSASHQAGSSNSQSAMCSSLSDMQYNCTAEFIVDINPSVDTIESVNVTVSGPYGSASSLKSISQGVNPISSIEETGIAENSAMLICKLPCFSPDIQCVLSQFLSCTDVNVTIDTGNITGSVESYSYPTQTISVSGLNSNTTYNYCVVLTNTTNMMMVGGPKCGSFTTPKIINEANDDSSLSTEVTVAITFVITFILTLIIATVITAIITFICVKRKFEKIIQDFKDKEQNKTVFYEQVGPSNQAITKNDFELQTNPAYGVSHRVIMDTNPAYESCK